MGGKAGGRGGGRIRSLKKEELKQVLTSHMGLSPYEAEVYATLVATGRCSVSDLTVRCSVPREKIYPTLRKLAKKGLVVQMSRSPIEYAPVRPATAFGDLILRKQEELSDIKRSIEMLEELYARYVSQEKVAVQQFWLTSERGEVVERLRRFLTSTAKRLSCFLTPFAASLLVEECFEELVKLQKKRLELVFLANDIEDKNIGKINTYVDVRFSKHFGDHALFVSDARELIVLRDDCHLTHIPSSTLAEAVESAMLSAYEGAVPLDRVAEVEEELLVGPDAITRDSIASIVRSALAYWVEAAQKYQGGPQIAAYVGEKLLQALETTFNFKVPAATPQDSLAKVLPICSLVDDVDIKATFDGDTKMLTIEIENWNGDEGLPGLTAPLMEALMRRHGYVTEATSVIYDKKSGKLLVQKALKYVG